MAVSFHAVFLISWDHFRSNYVYASSCTEKTNDCIDDCRQSPVQHTGFVSGRSRGTISFGAGAKFRGSRLSTSVLFGRLIAALFYG